MPVSSTVVTAQKKKTNKSKKKRFVFLNNYFNYR